MITLTPGWQAVARMLAAACCQRGCALLRVATQAVASAVVMAVAFTKVLRAAVEAWWACTCSLSEVAGLFGQGLEVAILLAAPEV